MSCVASSLLPSTSSRSRIDLWLRDLAETSAEPPLPQFLATSAPARRNRKRQRDDTPPADRLGLRTVLKVMSGNEQTPARRSQRIARGDQTRGRAMGTGPSETTRAKTGRRHGKENDKRQEWKQYQAKDWRQEEEQATGGGAYDEDGIKTPTARAPIAVASTAANGQAYVLRAPPHFAVPVMAAPASPARSDYSIPSSTSQVTQSIAGTDTSTKSRARSPVKSADDLRFAQWPIIIGDPPDDCLPDELIELDASLNAIKTGQQIIPLSMLDKVKAGLKRGLVLLPNAGYEDTRDSFDIERERRDLQEICDATSHHKDANEASWNCKVHSPLFQLAFRHMSGVADYNITSVSPLEQYLPVHYGSRIPLQKHFIDFTINLEPSSPAMEGKITHLLQHLPMTEQSITQTSYVPTRLRPSAISVETKATKGTEDKARIQLALWVATHFNKMQALVNARRNLLLERGIEEDGPALRIPFHPIIVTDARVFTIMYAIEISHNAAPPSLPLPLPPQADHVLPIGDVTNRRQSTIYIQEGPQFDAPSSLLEAYRSLAAMRCLGKWADEYFRKWFEEELLAEL